MGTLIAALAMVILIVVNRNPDDGATPANAGPFRAAALTVGLQDDQITAVIDDSVAARVDRLAASGVTFTRLDVSWVTIAPTAPAAPTDPNDPAYLWERFDAVVDALVARSLEPIVAFSGSPSWANGGGGPEAAPDVEAYGAFVRAFATRYSGQGRPRIRVFEPWDAPNNPSRLMPQWDSTGTKPASPATYAALLNRAYAEIKAVAPDATVVGSSAGHIEASAPPLGGVGVLDWLGALTALAPKMDAVAQHMEPTSAPSAPSEAVPSFSTLPRLMQELGRLAPGAPVLITKLDYATPPGGLAEADQAAYLTQALQRLAGESAIRLVIWGSLRDSPGRFAGLLHEDGSEKPSWAVFAGGQKALPSAATP